MLRFPTSVRAQFLFLTSRLAAPRALRLIRSQRSIADLDLKGVSASPHWFTSSTSCLRPDEVDRDQQRLHERNVKLGNTIRILHHRLPTLLVSPLPQEILSPQITLHLFPSTHPHLPTVGGKIAYTAALWTAPVAWGRVPVVGNVKLRILSERMVKNGTNLSTHRMQNEKLIVRWQTWSKSDEQRQSGQVSDAVGKMMSIVSGSHRCNEEFTGLFKFEFDEEGRIVNHVIEHTEEGQHWEKTTKVISVTDWLLGRAWGRREEASPSLAFAPYCRWKVKARPHSRDR